MNCEDFESNVNDLARQQMIEASVRTRALAHCDECEACARRLENETALSFGLRALANETNAVAVPALGNDLRAELRNNFRRMPPPAHAQGVRRSGYWAAGAAVAATLLLVIAVVAMRPRSTPPPIVQRALDAPNVKFEGRPNAPTPVVAIDLKPLTPSRDNIAGNRKVRAQRRDLKRPSQDSLLTESTKDIATAAATTDTNVATEITTEFMPVGYATETSMQEGGQLVRVELPRSALIAFGLPMNVNRYDEKVKADVFFGADGIARAIRFVQ